MKKVEMYFWKFMLIITTLLAIDFQFLYWMRQYLFPWWVYVLASIGMLSAIWLFFHLWKKTKRELAEDRIIEILGSVPQRTKEAFDELNKAMSAMKTNGWKDEREKL